MHKPSTSTREKWGRFGMAALGLLLSLTTASAFNIDTGSVVVHSGPRNTCNSECMFGFAVAQHKEAGVPWLLVGAPEADTQQPGVHKGGAVYRCSASHPGDCSIIPFHRSSDGANRTAIRQKVRTVARQHF